MDTNIDLSQRHSRTSTVTVYFPLRLHCPAQSERLLAIAITTHHSRDNKNTNFQLIQWEPFPLQHHCTARCNRHRNADNVSIFCLLSERQ